MAPSAEQKHQLLLLFTSLTVGITFGVGIYAFVYGKATSYLTNDPSACANCHIMNSQYDGWTKSSHHAVAVCNDCHTPNNFVGKYLTKAVNGFNHSWAFTTQWFHEPIQIKGFNRDIAEQQCRSCHERLWDRSIGVAHVGNDESCIRCHGSVGHR